MRLPRLQLGMRELMLLVACCAISCWVALTYRETDPIVAASRRLRSRDVDTRRAAALELGVPLSDARPALPALLEATRDDDAEVRRAAAEAIGLIAQKRKAVGPADPAAVRALIPLLHDPDPKVREAAAIALGKIAAPMSAHALAEALRDPDPAVRRYAAGGLRAIGPPARSETPALLAAIAAEADPADRAGLMRTLPEVDPDPAVVVPPLAERLARDNDNGARAGAARVLGAVVAARLKAGESPVATLRAVAALRGALADPWDDVRTSSIAALGLMRDAARGPLAVVLDGVVRSALAHREANVRSRAAFVFSSAGRVSGADVRALGKALGDEDADVRRDAAMALARIARAQPAAGSKLHDAFASIVPALRAALHDDDRQVRCDAFTALTTLSHQAPDGDSSFRDGAREATAVFVALFRNRAAKDRELSGLHLGYIDPRDADLVLAPLRDAAANDPSPDVRKAATASVARITFAADSR